MSSIAGTGHTIPENELIRISTSNNSNIIYCPNCGAANTLVLDWYDGIQILKFCWQCGKEI